MFLFVSVVLASSFFVSEEQHPTTNMQHVGCGDLHSNPVQSIDHGKFHFSPLSVGFMMRRKFDIPHMILIEEEIMAHPGQQSIRSKYGFYIAVTGIKGQERHPGCFKHDDQCRVLDLLESIRK